MDLSANSRNNSASFLVIVAELSSSSIWYNSIRNAAAGESLQRAGQGAIMLRETIKTFVRKTLGCGCPEDVFRSIDCWSHVRVNGIILRNRINVGNRLLIYIFETDDAESVREALSFLVSKGRKERDERGFNRLRIVLVAEDRDQVIRTAEEEFRNADKDDKIHLHILDKKSMPDF